MDNAELVRRSKNGDTDAFAELYERVSAKLYRTALYLIGDREEAQDAVMDAVSDAFASVARLRSDELFEAWIMKILYNKARRRRGKYYINAACELDESTADGDAPLDEIADDNADLFKAMSELSETDRAIITLSVCGGYSSKQISSMLGINANTVRSRQSRALARLRILMKGEE